jgi:hypothetical protein
MAHFGYTLKPVSLLKDREEFANLGVLILTDTKYILCVMRERALPVIGCGYAEISMPP